MQRDDMKDLLWFLAVARERSFTKAAAKARNVTVDPEPYHQAAGGRLGVRLLTRTTRSVAPTEAGNGCFSRLHRVSKRSEADIASLVALRDKPAEDGCAQPCRIMRCRQPCGRSSDLSCATIPISGRALH